MRVIPTQRYRWTVIVACSAFSAGASTMFLFLLLTTEPEVVTISEAVPSSCAQAMQSATEGFKASQRVQEYEDKASELAGGVTLSVLAADADKMRDALAPIAEHNRKEEQWNETLLSARESFDSAAQDCLAKWSAAEALRNR